MTFVGNCHINNRPHRLFVNANGKLVCNYKREITPIKGVPNPISEHHISIIASVITNSIVIGNFNPDRTIAIFSSCWAEPGLSPFEEQEKYLRYRSEGDRLTKANKPALANDCSRAALQAKEKTIRLFLRYITPYRAPTRIPSSSSQYGPLIQVKKALLKDMEELVSLVNFLAQRWMTTNMYFDAFKLFQFAKELFEATGIRNSTYEDICSKAKEAETLSKAIEVRQNLDILTYIFSFLDPQDLPRIRKVSTLWNKAAVLAMKAHFIFTMKSSQNGILKEWNGNLSLLFEFIKSRNHSTNSMEIDTIIDTISFLLKLGCKIESMSRLVNKAVFIEKALERLASNEQNAQKSLFWIMKRQDQRIASISTT